jgi:hypothetical protein
LFTPLDRHTAAHKSSHGLEYKQQEWIFSATAVLFGFVVTAASACGNQRRMTNISTTTTRCEDGTTISSENADDPDSPGPHNDFGAKPVENDPYINLPEVDEETTCDICNTFRKGPCRKYWRKTERCWKEGDSDKCLPYSTPFLNCSMYYRNLYVLVMLDNFQEYITAMENDAASVAVRQFSDGSSHDDGSPYVLVDWNPWNEFNKDFGPSFSQTIPTPPSNVHSNNKNPLWQRLPKDTEPILVPCNVKIPTRFTSLNDVKKLMHLKVAYVTDQDGFVVGKYFKPSKFNSDDHAANDSANISSDSSDTSKNDASDNSVISSTNDSNSSHIDETDNEDAHAEISCILLPGETKSITVTAYYSDNIIVVEDDSEEDAAVYKREYDLYKMLAA